MLLEHRVLVDIRAEMMVSLFVRIQTGTSLGDTDELVTQVRELLVVFSFH